MIRPKRIGMKILEALSGIEETTTHWGLDFSEKREATNMIVVTVNSVEQANVGLPDYRMTFTGLVDSLIADDRDGQMFDDIVDEVGRRIEAIADRDADLNSYFGEEPVVGFFLKRTRFIVTDTSNRCEIETEVVVSE